MKTTIKVICYKSKVLANGESPLMLRVTKDRKRSMKSLGISVHPDFWNFEKQEPLDDCPNKKEIDQLILKTKIEFQQKLLSEKVQGNDYSAESIVKGHTVNVPKITVDEFYLKTIISLRESGNIGNSDVYNVSYNSLRNFNKGKPLHFLFKAIDSQYLTRYELFLRSNGNKEITISNRFKTLRALYNKAISEHLVLRHQSPFNDFKLSKFHTKTIKRALRKDEIRKIINFIPEGDSSKRLLAHSIFCFSYFCGGISFVDIANLKYENIQNDRLVYRRQKTNGLINIPLIEEAHQYLNKFVDHRNTASYLFPILNCNIHLTPVQKNDRVLKVRKQVNRELRSIGQELELPLKLTTYVARHSFATILKNSGVNVALISEALGHSELSTTQIYLDSFENSQFNEAMKNLL